MNYARDDPNCSRQEVGTQVIQTKAHIFECSQNACCLTHKACNSSFYC